MTPLTHLRKMAALGLLAAASLLLSGCLFSPGKFTAALDLRKSGAFTFTYAGEINMISLSKLSQMDGNAEFVPSPCYNDEDGAERTCSAAELTDQRTMHDEAQKASAERKAKDAEQMKAMLGGLDPTDEKSAEELAQRLRRQAGWRSVEYKGNGLFVVDYALSGTLTHDFRFPNIERMTAVNAFVEMSLRGDGSVRIDAPGFGPQAGGSAEPMRAMMQMAAADKGDPALAMSEMDGTFTLRTDGEVLANNTEEGPQADPAGRKLVWLANADSTAAPMALVKLAR